MRLTEKDGILKLESIADTKWNDAIIKLGSLEDIEEELGIDLITLIKVWNAVLRKEYLWTKYDNELDETDDIEIGDEMNGLLYIYFYWCSGKHLTFYLGDYGKTWALTKEELKK